MPSVRVPGSALCFMEAVVFPVGSEYRAVLRLCDSVAIYLLPRRLFGDHQSGLTNTTLRQFIFREVQLHLVCVQANVEPVAGIQQSEPTTDDRFRSDIQDRGTCGRTTLAAVTHGG